MESTPPPSDAPPQERPLSFFTAAIWSLVAMMVVSIGVTLTEADRTTVDPVSRTACLAIGYSITFFGVLRLHEPQTSIRHVLALRNSSILILILALAIGAALSLPSAWIDNALEARFPTSPEESEAASTLLAVPTLGKRVALFATLVLAQPILTELFFRGVLFTPLRRTRRVETVILASAAFELLGSFSPRSMISLLAATLVFSWIRGLTGSVIPAILAHVAFNGVGIVPICLGKGELAPTRQLLIASGITALVSLFGLSFFSRGARAIEARQRDAGEVPL